MPLQATSGAASYDAFGGGVAAVPNYIEDVFSTYLYKGTGSQNQNITNGIDLSTNGGLVWIKSRNVTGLDDHWLQDTARGIRNGLNSNTTNAQSVNADIVTAVLTNGYTDSVGWGTSDSVASWTFREQPKFFDVVTYTGTGSARTIAHNLGSVPGCIIIKNTSNAGGSNWAVYHRGLGTPSLQYLAINSTAAAGTSPNWWNSTDPTSTVFSLGTGFNVNNNGDTYVAYLFAHNAGGFGLTGTDNVISCGSVSVTNGSYADVNLGYEPQFVMLKASSTTGAWFMNDTMRGMPATPSLAASLSANSSAAEVAGDGPCFASSTGFTVNNNNVTGTYIYIAIRRGPMKVPTSGTSVFTSITKTGATSVGQTNTTNFPVDLSIDEGRATNYGATFFDRLRGSGPYLNSSSTAAEANQSPTYYVGFDSNTSVFNKNYGALGGTYVNWLFRRAPSFMDVVCYTGTGVAGRAVLHNLGVAPELLIAKERSGVGNWEVIAKDALGGLVFYQMNSTQAGLASRDGHLCFPTATFVPPTATQFVVGADDDVNGSGSTYVAYLFATCAGVSKVGSYTGTGTTKQVDCGFTGGARFVLIKRTDSTGAWYVWDSARGIVAGNDPYLLLNSTAAEVTNTDYVDTYSAGFEISSTAPAAINASGGTYIFLAIA